MTLNYAAMNYDIAVTNYISSCYLRSITFLSKQICVLIASIQSEAIIIYSKYTLV